MDDDRAYRSPFADGGEPFFHESYQDLAPPRGERPQLKSAASFCLEYVPLAYVVEPVIRTQSMYSLTAKTGAGKTAFAVSLCLAVATGRSDLIGMDVEQGRVAYLAFENPDDVRMRLMTAAYLLNVDLRDVGDDFVILDARAKPIDLVDELRARSVDGGNFILVVLDTFAAGFDGTDINDNVQAGEFLRRLRPITQLDGLPALVIPAHPTKNAAEDNLVPYGGGAILNEVDGNLTLSKRTETGNTVLHWQGKFRGLEFTPRHFRFEIVGCPDVIDNKNRQVQIPVLRPTSAEEVEERVAVELDREIRVLQAIAEGEGRTPLRQIASEINVSKSAVERHAKHLAAKKLADQDLKGNYRVTAAGSRKLKEING